MDSASQFKYFNKQSQPFLSYTKISEPTQNKNLSTDQIQDNQNANDKKKNLLATKPNPFINNKTKFFVQNTSAKMFSNNQKNKISSQFQSNQDKISQNKPALFKAFTDNPQDKSSNLYKKNNDNNLFSNQSNGPNLFSKQITDIFGKVPLNNQPLNNDQKQQIFSLSSSGAFQSQSLFNKKDQFPKPNIFEKTSTKDQKSLLNISNISASNIFYTRKEPQDLKPISSNENKNEKKSFSQQLSSQSQQNQEILKKQNQKFDKQSKPIAQNKEATKQYIKQTNKKINILNNEKEKKASQQQILNFNQFQQNNILKKKREQIWEVIKRIEQKGDKLQLQSKSKQLKELYQKLIEQEYENSCKENQELQQKIKHQKQILKQIINKVQSIKEKNKKTNHFEQIVSLINQQQIAIQSLPDNDSYQVYPDEKFIDNQIENLINKLDQHYSDYQINNDNPQSQIKNLYKSLQQQCLKQETLSAQFVKYNQLNVNVLILAKSVKSNPALLRKQQARNSFLPHLQTSSHQHHQQKTDINIITSLVKQDNIVEIIQGKQQALNLEELRNQNKAKIRNLFTLKQKIKDKRAVSKISQGKTSMIMKSIVMQ